MFLPPWSDSPVPITVPVSVDGVVRNGANGLVRCVYFTIVAEDPRTNWFLGLPGYSVPFLMLGLQGIIHRPIRGGSNEFTSPDLFDELIDAVERLEGMSVETEYLWLPAGLLDRAWRAAYWRAESEEEGAPRGSVFRVSEPLFTDAFGAAREGTRLQHFATAGVEYPLDDFRGPSARYSPEETSALRAWSRTQALENARFERRALEA